MFEFLRDTVQEPIAQTLTYFPSEQRSPHCVLQCEYAPHGDNENHNMRRFVSRNDL